MLDHTLAREMTVSSTCAAQGIYIKFISSLSDLPFFSSSSVLLEKNLVHGPKEKSSRNRATKDKWGPQTSDGSFLVFEWLLCSFLFLIDFFINLIAPALLFRWGFFLLSFMGPLIHLFHLISLQRMCFFLVAQASISRVQYVLIFRRHLKTRQFG